MKDFFGQELQVGDSVAFMEPQYRNMTHGKILKITPKMMLLEYPCWYDKKVIITFRATPDQVIKNPIQGT